MATSIPTLHSQKNLKTIFKTLENQNSEIFSGYHNTHSASITSCFENLAQLISPDDDEYFVEDFKSFINNGVCTICRNYEMQRETVSPIVLNFLMTAIRSYNHIQRTSENLYHFPQDVCPGASDTGNAFLLQVLCPFIDAGALHVFPVDEPLNFKLNVKQTFIMRSPSPEKGPRRKSKSFGKAFKQLQRSRRRDLGYRSNSSDTGSESNGGSRRRRRCKTNLNKRNTY